MRDNRYNSRRPSHLTFYEAVMTNKAFTEAQKASLLGLPPPAKIKPVTANDDDDLPRGSC